MNKFPILDTERLRLVRIEEDRLAELDLPEISDISSQEELSRRCGTYVRSLDYPNLFFLGQTLLDINGSTPLIASAFSRTIMSHIRGKCVIPTKVYLEKPVHWSIFAVLASFDRSHFWPFFWRLKYRIKAWYYARYPKSAVRFP